MIATCRTCRRCYWKYRSDWPYPGFCTWFCYTLRPLDPLKAETVEDVKFLIRIHLELTHNDERGSGWYPDCRRCEQLEKELVDLRRLEVCIASQGAASW